MSIIIDGKKKDILGLITRSWLDTDDPKRPPVCVKDTLKNDRKVSGIIVHTTRGIGPATIRLNSDGTPYEGTDELAGMAYARYWNKSTGRAASAALIVCHNGTVLNISDLRDEVSWHACGANSFTIGIEMCQYKDGTLSKATLEATVKLIDFLTREFGIQRQIPMKMLDDELLHPIETVIPRLNQDNNGPAGRDFYGIWAHRNNTNNRGFGDAGNVIFDMLHEAGYEGFDVSTDEDKKIWKDRQKLLGLSKPDCDGIPGQQTRVALMQKGYPHGLWITRPGD